MERSSSGEFRGGGGGLSGLKKELLGWKHPRAQNVGEGRLSEEGDEGGEDGDSLRFVSPLFPSWLYFPHP